MAISFSSGQLVTSAQLNLLCPTLCVKSANQSVTNSATLVNDNDIVFTFVANQTVEVCADFVYSQSSTTQVGLRAAWSSTGTLTLLTRTGVGAPDTGSPAPDNMQMQSRPATLTGNTLYGSGVVANAQFVARERLLLTTGASGCTLQFQFAQYTATASQSITMLAGSFAIARYCA